ncbi:unnamed protein product [Meloidogyne enterolobii]|uniref:Uncharacterized protein n=1 Tax=Meloidogyne enterolobii TaxID=390850 RepID=A0ACB0XPK8_MELEN
MYLFFSPIMLTSLSDSTITTINAFKAVLLILLFFGTFLASTSFLLIKKYVMGEAGSNHSSHFGRKLISLISCFGGGVFLATCLLDLLPDSINGIKSAEKRLGYQIKFPLPAFCVSLGFLIVLILEQAIIYANKRNWLSNSFMERLSRRDDGHGILTLNRRTNSNENLENTHLLENDDNELELNEDYSIFRILLMVFALSLHAVFEGLSVGMMTDVNLLLQVFFALLIHKTIVGFSLGLRLVQSRLYPPTVVLCCAVFSLQVCIGGFTGLAATACGTFLYVTAFEILPHELNNDSNIPQKMISLVLGFALISIFIALFPDSDS